MLPIKDVLRSREAYESQIRGSRTQKVKAEGGRSEEISTLFY